MQYAKAMGLHVAALDVTEEKLALARASGADVTVNAKAPDASAQVIKETGGGAHGVLVTVVSPAAFAQALKLVRRKGTISLVGLPPGEFQTSIFDVVMNRITIRGSIVGAAKIRRSNRILSRRQGSRGNSQIEIGRCQQGIRGPEGWNSQRSRCAGDVSFSQPVPSLGAISRSEKFARHSEPGAPNFGYPPQRAAQQSGSRYGQSDLLASSKAKGDQAFAFAGQNSNTAANSVTWFESGATRLFKPM